MEQCQSVDHDRVHEIRSMGIAMFYHVKCGTHGSSCPERHNNRNYQHVERQSNDYNTSVPSVSTGDPFSGIISHYCLLRGIMLMGMR